MAARGVTLLELLAVVAIIGIFLALAAPSISKTLDDRRAGALADDISGMFRVARTRAASTGATHVVSATVSTGGLVKLVLMNAFDPASLAPINSCFSPSWTPGVGIRVMQTIDPVTDKTLGPRGIEAIAANPASLGLFCFTPSGSSWWKSSGGVWKRPQACDSLQYEIHRKDTAGNVFGLQRFVVVGSSGIPRIDVPG